MLAATLALGVGVGARASVAAASGDAAVSWENDYDLALEKALLTRRPVLVFFYADWCGWCRKLDREAFRDPRFADMARDLIPVRINGERERGLAALFRVTGFPVTVVLSRQGRVLGRISGYRPAGEFLDLVARGLEDREPVSAAREAALRRPSDPQAAYDLGDVLLASGSYAEAREAFERAAELSAAGAGDLVAAARLDAALTYSFAGEYEAALPLFEDYLARFPDDDRRDQGLYFYGRALIAAGQGDAGRDRIREAAEHTTFRSIREAAEDLRVRSGEEGYGG